MPRPSNASPRNVAATAAEWYSRGTYTGAGAAVPVKTNGKGQTLTRQGVGLYTVTFTDFGGRLVAMDGDTYTAATVAPGTWKIVPASINAANRTVQIEHYLAGVLADPPAASLVSLKFVFLQNTVD